jgi:hypothetical protein
MTRETQVLSGHADPSLGAPCQSLCQQWVAEFWKGLKEIAATKGVPVQDLISKLHTERQHANLSSVIRLFVLDFYRGKV